MASVSLVVSRNMTLKKLKEVKNLKGEKVLLRVDYNVPLEKKKLSNGKYKMVVQDDTKIKETIPTINYLLEKGAKVILISHFGDPKGKIVKDLTMEPIGEALYKLLKEKMECTEIVKDNYPFDFIGKMAGGEVVLLENLRFNIGEEKNDTKFAKYLASLADIYVNDAFAVSHRAHASVSKIANFLPSYAGLLLEKEIEVLSKLLANPKKPFVAITGGAKISTKIDLIKNLLKKVDCLMIGGAMANNFLKAFGYNVGASLVESDKINFVRKFLKNKKILLPIDVVVGDFDGKKSRIVQVSYNSKNICEKNEAILDIGPETIKMYEKVISKAKTLIWNGPMGYFENTEYNKGSDGISRIIAEYSKKGLLSVVGGGETLSIIKKTGVATSIAHVSTGGGAMLEFLEGKILPGIKPLLRQ